MTTQQNTDEDERQDVKSSDENVTGETGGHAETEPAAGESGERHGTVDAKRHAEVLERDGYQCRVCGRRGPQRGGLATLHIHHLEREPDGMDEDDPQNLTTLCRGCHNWVHQRSTPTESPVSLTEADLSVLLPHDIEILQVLAESGPARTGDIADRLSIDLSVTATRERLWVLMGLDRMVASRDRQIVDQDVETGEWGLVGQIETSARGHIPDSPQVLLQRIEDEQVREALDRGVDRAAIMDVLDISRRSTFYKQKRACAYSFPLDAFRRGEETALNRDSLDHDTTVSDTADGQQQLDTIIEAFDDDEMQSIETWGKPGTDDTSTDEADVPRTQPETDQEAVGEQLQTAIDALEEVNSLL